MRASIWVHTFTSVPRPKDQRRTHRMGRPCCRSWSGLRPMESAMRRTGSEGTKQRSTYFFCVLGLCVGKGVRRRGLDCLGVSTAADAVTATAYSHICTHIHTYIHIIRLSTYLLVKPGGVRAAQIRHHRDEGDLPPVFCVALWMFGCFVMGVCCWRGYARVWVVSWVNRIGHRSSHNPTPTPNQQERTTTPQKISSKGTHVPFPMVFSTRRGTSWQSGCTEITRSGSCASMQSLNRWWHARFESSSVPHLEGGNLRFLVFWGVVGWG